MSVVCPKCGSDSGYYHRAIYSHRQDHTFGGEPDNCEVTFIRGGERKYCSDCDKDITDFVLKDLGNEY